MAGIFINSISVPVEEGDYLMGKFFQSGENIFVLPVNMENRPAEDIARDAALSILEVCEQVGRQREAERKARKEAYEKHYDKGIKDSDQGCPG